MKRIYSIKHTLWYQRELEFDENERIAEVKKFISDSLAGEKKIGDIADELFLKDENGNSKGHLLLEVVLKSYNPTPAHWLWNHCWAWYYGIKLQEIKYRATDSALAKIIVDFFFFRLYWTTTLTNSIVNSVLSLQKSNPVENQQPQN